jgi:hypothetical protein
MTTMTTTSQQTTSQQTTSQQTISLRVPRGLWQDLEETVIQQDRQFLTEVARSLGLPVAEVLRKCLGTGGATQSIPVLWSEYGQTEAPEACPWWDCHGDGLWRRCPRLRLSASLPCALHERWSPSTSTARIDTDPFLRTLPVRTPVSWKGTLYWVDPTATDPPLREDGTVDATCQFVRANGIDAEWYFMTEPCLSQYKKLQIEQ